MLRYFTFDGTPSTDYELIVTKVKRPILPTLIERKLTIPGKDGAWDFGNNTYEESEIEVYCTILDPIYSRERIRQIAGWLSTKGQLIFSDEPLMYYVGRIYETFTEEIEGSTGEFVIKFKVEPFTYATSGALNNPINYDENYLYDDENYYPNEETFNWIHAIHGSGLNNGTAETDVTITIFGNVEGIKITHVESGKYLDINVTLAQQTLIINTEDYTIEKSNVNVLGDLQTGSEFFKLDPGENGLLFEGINPDCLVTYTWNQRYL